LILLVCLPATKGLKDPKKMAQGKSHTFSVLATDAAGNADKTPATLKFKVEPKPAKR
jgi:hypothetical protein